MFLIICYPGGNVLLQIMGTVSSSINIGHE
jgi:hypothetical protein